MAVPEVIARRGAILFRILFLFCVFVLGFALWLQHAKGLDPCPWCVVQRIVFVTIGIVALIAILHRPLTVGITAYSTLIGLLSIAGGGAAAYHIYLQSDPERAMKCAGSMVERLLDRSQLGHVVPPLFQYDGPCTLKPWAMLGLSIPEWSFVSFLAILIALGAAAYVVGRR